MGEYLTVGRFARLAGVTSKALKHYEKLKLLEPEYIDPITGYRYYKMFQIKKVYEIVSLKNLGLSLGEIKSIKRRSELKRVLEERKKTMEDEVKRLQESIELIKKKEKELLENRDFTEELQIRIVYCEERRYYRHLLIPPVEKADDPRLYMESLKMEKKFPGKRIVFKGALLDAEAFMRGKYRCISLLQIVKGSESGERKETFTFPEGRYLQVRYKGNTIEKNDEIMRRVAVFIEENSLVLSGRVMGFAHKGAHTKEAMCNYESEMQLELK